MFKGLGLTSKLTTGEARYLGGWSAQTKTYAPKKGNKFLVVDQRGVSFDGLKTIFTIPWSEIVGLDIEGPESAARRITATRMLTLGVFSLAAQKKEKLAVMIVRLRSGEEAIFDTAKLTAPELKGKLTPIMSQLRKANTTPEPVSQIRPQPVTNASAAPSLTPISVADELKKLAELKDAGVLTHEEFAVQKARVLGETA